MDFVVESNHSASSASTRQCSIDVLEKCKFEIQNVSGEREHCAICTNTAKIMAH